MSKLSREKIVLIDVNALVHRAYHAYPAHLSTSKGEQVNAVYGFTLLLLKVINDLNPKYILCAFDVAKPTVRHEKYKEYKAQRKPPEENLIKQFPRVKEVIEALNIPSFAMEGYEADDIIGTLSKDKKLNDLDVIIVTGDQDLFQLVDSHVKVYLSGRSFRDSKMYGEKEVKQKMGLRPTQVIDYKALRGDSSDNIPGVKGVGDKTARTLLEEYGTLEKVYKNVDKISERISKKLKEEKEKAMLSKDLAEIITDVQLPLSLKDCLVAEYDKKKVVKLFQELEFRSLLRQLPEKKKNDQDDIKTDTSRKFNIEKIIIEKKSQTDELIKKLERVSEIAFDTEATSLRYMEANLLGISLFSGDQSAYYIPVSIIKKKKELTKVGIAIRRVLEDEKVKKIGHNLKYDWHVLKNFGFGLKGEIFDTMIAAYLVNGGEGRVGLKELTFNHFGYLMKDLSTLLGKGKDKKTVEQIGIKELGDYSCDDAIGTWKLYEYYGKALDKEKAEKEEENLYSLFYNVEMPLLEVLLDMERNGMAIDKKKLEEVAVSLDKKLTKVEEDIFKFVGHEFNVNSPKQVGEVLFTELELPGGKKTKNGSFSTGERILKDLEGTHPVVNLILQFRELAKIRSTYTNVLVETVNEKTGRLHTSFNQAVTSTGRLSSSDPNLQNIPIASKWGKKVRSAFIAPHDKILVSFDYAQQELRLLAHFSKEDRLIQAFKENIDIHTLTASEILGLEIEKVGKSERRIGKTVNFGIIYGISPFGLADRLKINREDAKDYIEKYFTKYPKVRNYLDSLVAKAKKDGEIRSIMGRKRTTIELNSSNFHVKNAIEREIINFPLQAGAADLMKVAMVKVNEIIDNEFEQVRIILQIHDSLLFEVPKEFNKKKFNDFVKMIRNQMEGVYKLTVPNKVDVEFGQRWGSMETYPQKPNSVTNK